MSIARATRILLPNSIIALAAKRKSRSTLFLAAHERKLPKAAMDTQSYSVATVSTRRARSVGNRQKRLSLVAEGGFTFKRYMMSREASCLRLGVPLQ